MKKRLSLAVVATIFLATVAMGQAANSGNKRRAVKTGPPNGLFTPAIISGDLVFTSGQIGLDSKTGQLPEGSCVYLRPNSSNVSDKLKRLLQKSPHEVKVEALLSERGRLVRPTPRNSAPHTRAI